MIEKLKEYYRKTIANLYMKVHKEPIVTKRELRVKKGTRRYTLLIISTPGQNDYVFNLGRHDSNIGICEFHKMDALIKNQKYELRRLSMANEFLWETIMFYRNSVKKQVSELSQSEEYLFPF